MKTIFCLGSLGFVLTVLGTGLAAGDESVAETPKTRMHDQLALLVRNDAGVFTPPAQVEAANDEEVEVMPGRTLELEPMTVKGKKIEIPPPLHESPAQEFLRTGTIWESKHRTMRLWMKGDQGLMFTFLW